MSFSLPSYAKINWQLRILGKRPDGFHELFTVFQSVSLHDTITFNESFDQKLTLTSDIEAVPTDASNLITRAARALQDRLGIKKGAAIHLEKRIPSPGGLGGGSSNAAVTLIGLHRLWGLEIDDAEIKLIASALGSDVPFFLDGGTAIGTGRGEVVDATFDVKERFMVIVTPAISVSTKEAFERINATTLTNEGMGNILHVCRMEAKSRDIRRTVLKNDFELSVFSVHPEIELVKQSLFELGAVNAAMSGSGASVFAIFDKQETRQTALKALDQESTWRKFAVATISRSEYRDALFI